MKHVPNALTLIRLFLAPMIALLLLQGFAMGFVPPLSPEGWDVKYRAIAANFTFAAAFYVIAALTDLLDGIAARTFNAHSKFGRIIDPIADKALVGLPLIAFALIVRWSGDLWAAIVVCATAVIVVRDVIMTIVRLASRDGEGVRVSRLAKWKTALELLVVGLLLVGLATFAQVRTHFPATPLYEYATDVFVTVWTLLLVIAAALSAYTGWQYLRPAKPIP
jgi:cardiolipin synthase (CMP-forming)